MSLSPDEKKHYSHRVGWLRAAVLGANDGIVSTSALIIGMASAGVEYSAVVAAGCAGLVAGAMSMAAGEYVSVSSQADSEAADIELEKHHLATDFEYEYNELVDIYTDRGLDNKLACEVASQLMQKDALAAHTRDELGIIDRTRARPFQAAGSSALAFTLGALFPLLTLLAAPNQLAVEFVAGLTIVFLGVLGAVSAKVGGARLMPSIIRVSFWGAAAMLVTAAFGELFQLMG